MTSKFHISNAFKDGTTRLVVPDLSIVATNLLISLTSSFITAPKDKPRNFFADRTEGKLSTGEKMELAKSMLTNLLDTLTIGLGVVKLETAQDYVMPFSKGIGSTGEVIHLLGARNEIINLEFKTDRYPGRLAYAIKRLIQKILEEAVVVYVVDDLFLSTPCLIRRMKLSKEAKYRGAVMGELELVSLSTGNSFAKNLVDGKLSSFATQLKTGIKSSIDFVGSFGTGVKVGAVAISGLMVADILGGF